MTEVADDGGQVQRSFRSTRSSPAPSVRYVGQYGPASFQTESASGHESTSDEINVHQLRSSTEYHHEQQYVPRSTKLWKAFNSAYVPFRDGKPIPADALEKLEQFSLDSQEFYRLVTSRELPKSRYIYLQQGKVKFDEWTKPPHAEVIGEVILQIGLQDRPFGLFETGTGGGDYHYSFLS